ncbi:MAG TPA: DNA-processing protein DprA, partial [Candidatus Limnocylindrales bacterium]|nr:DNA-processing protein DprA [Candidatus Limnocylindrales bacterium]
VDGVGPTTLERLIGRFGTAMAVLDAARAQHATAALIAASRTTDEAGRAMSAAVADGIVDAATRTREILAALDATGVTIVTVEDAEYPPRLRAIDLPPHVLYVRGDVDALRTPAAVAIVGTRRPSEMGRLVAARIAAALAAVGAVVVSGLAVGIDGAAHAAVVSTHGRTVAVLGGGLDRLFPNAHVALAREIVATGGALVSELPPAAEPVPGTFPRRNRVISGLSQATIVVEAGARSGALITASWALEQGRDCFAVPGAIDSPTSAGCLALLREFPGQVRVVAGIPQLIADLEIELPDATGQPPQLAVPIEAVLGTLGAGPRRIAGELLAGRSTADELVAVTGLTIAGVLGALTLLESRGLVAGVYGRYRAVGELATAAAEVG